VTEDLSEFMRSHVGGNGLTHIGDKSTCVSEHCAPIPGVDRPWRYGDAYMRGEMAMRVTDPR